MSTSHLQAGKGARDIASLGRPDLLTKAPPAAPAGQLNYTNTNGALTSYPSPDKWDNWTEYESTKWPQKVARNYALVPTLCFNCEAGCGLLAYVDKDDMKIRKIEGNPLHPASRGRNCAKGWVTLNQVYDPDRIFYPLKRVGERGEGKWERVSWDEALDDIAGRIRKAIQEERRNSIIYHVGRPGEDGYMFKTLAGWGVDGHNSHTNVCSSSARIGQFLWNGSDRPSPDFTNADAILLISSHLDTGHYYNPSAQRIIEAQTSGAKLIVIDPRLSNTAAKADYWLPAYSGTESAILLAIARYLLDTGQFDAQFVEEWMNWTEYMRTVHPDDEASFDNFIEKLKQEYAEFTFEYAAEETGVSVDLIAEVAPGRRPRREPPLHPRLARGRHRQPARLAGGAVSALSAFADGRGGHGGRNPSGEHAQIRAQTPQPRSGAQRLERTPLSPGIPPRLLRDEFPDAPPLEGQGPQRRRLLYAGL